MPRFAFLVALVYLVGGAVCLPEAEARSRTVSAKQKKKKKRTRKKKQRARLNMPKGWAWPPSREMRAEGDACLDRLTALGVKWKRAPSTRKVATPIYLPKMELGGIELESIWRKGPFVMDCVLALAFAERGGPALYNVGVRKLRFSSIHDYREIGGKKGILSRHAIGLAMDVYELVDQDGVKHVVKDHYHTEGELLVAAEETARASGVFRTVLTPGNDPAHHHDHFHFEARTDREQYWGPEVDSSGR